jgi:hypothetical protein
MLRLFHFEKRNVPNKPIIPSLGVFHFKTTRRTEPLKTGVSFHLTFLVSLIRPGKPISQLKKAPRASHTADKITL